MLLGRFWRRSTWQGAYASVLSGTFFGLAVLLVPAFADWIKATFGGPAIPATAVALMAGVVTSLVTPRSAANDEERLAAVFAARAGK
jgi:SSS family solute:Na+ symporter